MLMSMIHLSKRICALVLISLLCGKRAHAQKETLYYQYQFSPMTINPAATGLREQLHMTAMFRKRGFFVQSKQQQQMSGGGQSSQTLAMDGAVADGKVGIGLQAVNDRLGTLGTTGVYGTLSYWINLPDGASVSIGGLAGVSFLPVYDQVSLTSTNKANMSYGAGVYYYSDTFFGGVSMPEVSKGVYGLGTGLGSYQSVRPLFIQAGYKLESGENLSLIPSVLVTQATGRPIGFDVNAKAWFMEKAGLGLSYRHNSLGYQPVSYVQVSAEYQLSDAIRVGLTYNSTAPEAPVNTFQKSVFELLFRYVPNPQKFTF